MLKMWLLHPRQGNAMGPLLRKELFMVAIG